MSHPAPAARISIRSGDLRLSRFRHGARIVLLAGLACGLLVHHPLFQRAFFDPKLAVLAWWTVAVGLFLAILGWRIPLNLRSHWALNLLLPAVLGWILVGTLIHRGGTSGPLTSPDWVPWAALVAVGGCLAVLGRESAQRVGPGMAMVASALGLVGVSQALGWDPLAPLSPLMGRNEYYRLPVSTFGNPNYGSLVLAPIYGAALGMALGRFLNPGTRKSSMGWILVALIGAAFVVLAKSRGGLLAIGVSTCVVVSLIPWSRFRKNGESNPATPPRQWVVPGAVVALTVVLGILVGVAGRTPSDPKSPSSIQYRLALWQDGFVQAARSPVFGVGPGTLANQLARDASPTLRAMPSRGFANERFDLLHQDWLQVAASRGWPVALGALILWGLIGWSHLKRLRGPGRDGLLALSISGSQTPVCLAGLGAWCSATVLSLTDFPFHYPASAAVIFVLVLAPLLPTKAHQGPGPNGLAFPNPLLAMACLVSLSLIPNQLIRDPLASLSLGQARQALGQGRWPAALVFGYGARFWGADAGLTGQVQVSASRQLGQFSAALDASQKWVKDRPYDPDGWNTLGAVQAENGQTSAAIESLKRAWDLSQANAAAALNIAILAHSSGQWAEAVQWFEKVWAANPELFEKESGRYDEARRMLGDLSPRGTKPQPRNAP